MLCGNRLFGGVNYLRYAGKRSPQMSRQAGQIVHALSGTIPDHSRIFAG